MKLLVSVIVPTRDEEANLDDLLDSLDFADEVIIFDSESSDRTPEIARARGATVVSRPFDNFARHKNWALDNIPFKHEWIMFVDADERVTPALAREIAAAITRPDGVAGFRIARKNFFQGKWLRRCGMYPDWQLRLFRRGRARYEDRLVHEHMLVDGPVRELTEPLIHEDHKGIERYFERHCHYASLEAVEAVRVLAGQSTASGAGSRRQLKEFSYRWIPFRPVAVFFYMYLVRLGFMDGRVGLRYCILRALYEFQVDLKIAELSNPVSAMAKKYSTDSAP